VTVRQVVDTQQLAVLLRSQDPLGEVEVLRTRSSGAEHLVLRHVPVENGSVRHLARHGLEHLSDHYG